MDDTRRKILHAAREIEREHGAAALTMRRIAARVGVTATALYRHFPDKEGLLRELRAEDVRTFQGYFERVLEHRRAGERLAYTGWAYLDFALEHPALYRTFFMERAESAGDRKAAGTVRVRAFTFLRERLDDCMRAGLIGEADAGELAAEVWAQMHGLISLYLMGAVPGTAESFRTVYARALDRLFEALTRSASRRGR